jgi:hypothetical protein
VLLFLRMCMYQLPLSLNWPSAAQKEFLDKVMSDEVVFVVVFFFLLLNMQRTVERSRSYSSRIVATVFALSWYSVAFLTFAIRWSCMVCVMRPLLYSRDREHRTHLVGSWWGPRPEPEAVAKRKSLCPPCSLPVCYFTKTRYESDCKCNIGQLNSHELPHE